MDEKCKSKIIRVISQFINSEVSTRKSKGVVIGLSGGVDSSVAASLGSQRSWSEESIRPYSPGFLSNAS